MSLHMLFGRRIMAVFQVLVILFGLYLIIQLLIKVFGGSWSSESLVTGLLIANISSTFTMAVYLARLGSDRRHLNSQFRCLATDFKRMVSEFNGHRLEFRQFSSQVSSQNAELKELSGNVEKVLKKH